MSGNSSSYLSISTSSSEGSGSTQADKKDALPPF